MERTRGSEKSHCKIMIIHAFTKRNDGDMKHSEENRKKVVQKLFGHDRELIAMPQKHSNIVGVDALVTKRSDGALAVFSADCVPILLADRKNNCIAAIHAGWRGTLGEITRKTIQEMEKNGSNPKDILAWVGPHIGMCHYDVPEDRAQKFLQAFDHDPKVASYFEGAWHVDIGYANYKQLLDTGVTPAHIDAPPTCTVCQIDTYFSYRKDTPETFGRIMGVIGFGYGN